MDRKVKEKVMDLLVEEEVLLTRGGPFKTSSGLDVPFYVDFRRVASNPRVLNFICQIFSEEIEKNHIEAIGGIETAGIPFATAVSLITNKPSFWLRKKIRNHGLLTIIAGKRPKIEDKIALIDDSIGGGESLKVAKEYLEKEGYKINLFVYIMEGDIMQTLKKREAELNKEGIKLWFICTWKEWIDYLLNKKKISPKLAQYNYDFINNPLSFDKEKLNRYKNDLDHGEIWIGEKN